MKFSLAGVLGSIPLATDDEGPSSPRHATRRKIAIKAKGKASDKNTLVSANRPMEVDHIDLTRGADPMQTDGDQTTGDSLEVHHLKKKNSSLKKSCEASEARVKERDEEIDNLRSALARAQHDFMESYKALSEYQYNLYAYGADSMSTSISLTKE
ncbi:hypothetical protein Fot_05838 [Forsythia ovata]|uniref:Uncharacterized protein n=1 Tax=Forsythia ovata TaxID=205694 RepID=A0ABD1WRC8_9LAMI